MRNIILQLNEMYGAHHNKIITTWLNEQSARIAQFDKGSVSLVDLDEDVISAAIKRLWGSIPLSAEQLTKHAMLLPVMNQSQTDFEAIFRFKPEFYTFLLQASGNIIVDALEVVRKGDKFERYGHDRHVVHKPKPKNDKAPIELAYLNGTAKDAGLPFSVVLNKDEIAGIQSSQITKLFNGVNPYSDADWADTYKAAVMERLFDEDVFNSLEARMGENALNAYKAVKLFNAERYQSNERANLKVYSSFGKHIATKKNRFNAAQKLEHKRNAVKLTVIDNPNAGSIGKAEDNEHQIDDSIMQDFGGF